MAQSGTSLAFCWMVRANWFLAFPLGGRFLQQLPAPPSGFRLFHEQDLHLTLAFLGACGESAAQHALVELEQALGERTHGPIDVTLGEVVAMGSQRRYSALSALLVEGREQTEACMAALRDRLLASAGAAPELRQPKAHVTLARPKRSASERERAAGLVWASELDVRGVRARLDRVVLYTWDEARVERLFRSVAERRLG